MRNKTLLPIIFVVFSSLLFPTCNKNRENNQVTGKPANPGFEETGDPQSPSGWKTRTEGNYYLADFTVEGGYNSKYCLKHSFSSTYKVSTFQEIKGLEEGYYYFSAWIRNSGNQEACYLFAENYGGELKMTSLPVSAEWKKVYIRGIHITGGNCTLGIYSEGDGETWCMIDNISLVRDFIPYDFLKGGDISELNYIESMGGEFFENNTKKDPMIILKENGFNLARIRLYNDPGNPAFSPSNRLPKGFQDAADILKLAKRSREQGMSILLTIYYSDYWSNGKPHAWEGISFDALEDSVYAFTFDFMNRMKDEGTLPQFVSLGNEIQGGILKPDGSSAEFAKLALLLRAGYRGVKDSSPETLVVLHLDDAGNLGKYEWFFGECEKYDVNYDIIGASYYPFWTRKTVDEVIPWAEKVFTRFGKKILIMETGYNWNPVLPDGKNGQLSDNGPYDSVYPSSPSGQRDFLLECFSGLKSASGGCIIGDLYWDPVMIEVEGVGWELGADNVVSNTTLFDFQGNALPALDAFKFN